MIRLQTVRLAHAGLGDFSILGPVRLAQGQVQEPSSQPAGIQPAIDQAIQSLNTEIEALIVELDAVSPSAISVEPGRAKEISYVGSLPPGQIRLAIQTAANSISARIDRITSGALSYYLSQTEQSQLAALRSRSDSVSAAASSGWSAIPPESQGMVDQYLSMHLGEIDQAIRSAEELIVSGESGSVPVIEPFEKDSPSRNIAIGVGLVALTGLVLWGLLG